MALDPTDPFGLLALTARLDALERDLAALRAQQPTPAPTPTPTPGPAAESAHKTSVTDRIGQIVDRTLNVYKLAA